MSFSACFDPYIYICIYVVSLLLIFLFIKFLIEVARVLASFPGTP
jgi:hypothetical protein